MHDKSAGRLGGELKSNILLQHFFHTYFMYIHLFVVKIKKKRKEIKSNLLFLSCKAIDERNKRQIDFEEGICDVRLQFLHGEYGSWDKTFIIHTRKL